MKNIILIISTFLLMGTTFMIAGGNVTSCDMPAIEEEVINNDTGVYVGIAYAAVNNKTVISNGVNGEVDYNGFMLQAGYKFNPYISLEGRYWNTRDEKLRMSSPIGHPNEIDTQFDAWGIYLKPMYPVTEVFDVYALLGWGGQNTVNYTHSPKDSGFSWGLGAAYAFTNHVSVFLDYVSIYDDTAIENSIDPRGNNIDIDIQSRSLNIGMSYSF